ncbi:MAG TPA: hypothetical protein VFP28_03890 [Gemmatimonadales bacterium]|nr:hypothetical protein [Gemmatimonadales bacterium]
MVFRISPLAAVLVLSGAAATASAQASAADAASTSLALTAAAAPDPLPSALKSEYHLRLTSRWPQESLSADCRNGGEETLDGTLSRNGDGTYSGRFTRETRLLFCGAHGPVASACSLVLVGEGRVAMTGVVMADDNSPSGRSIRVTWSPAAGQQAAVTGDCAEGFQQAVRGMYLSTLHAAEFPLTTVGSGPRTDELESYAWRVEQE